MKNVDWGSFLSGVGDHTGLFRVEPSQDSESLVASHSSVSFWSFPVDVFKQRQTRYASPSRFTQVDGHLSAPECLLLELMSEHRWSTSWCLPEQTSSFNKFSLWLLLWSWLILNSACWRIDLAPLETGRLSGALLLLLPRSVADCARHRRPSLVILSSGLEKHAMYPPDGWGGFDLVGVRTCAMQVSTSVLLLGILRNKG